MNENGPAVEQNGETLSFPFISEVLGLSLHYGFFDKDVQIHPSLETLANGQKRFLQEIVTLIPPEVQSLLDVGTGTGDVAEAIAKKNIQVTTISPDPNQAEWVQSRLNSNLHFELCKFEKFTPKQKLDCVLFSESSNYVSLSQLFSKSRKNISDTGYLIVAAPFLVKPSKNFPDMHLLDDFYRYIKENKWMIDLERDYTDETAPTLWIGQKILQNHAAPMMRLFKKYLTHQAPWYVRLLGKILNSETKKLDTLMTTSLPQRLDPEAFRRDVRFMFFRLRPKI